MSGKERWEIDADNSRLGFSLRHIVVSEIQGLFRNWGGESVKHNFRREVLEHCLSHRVGDESELSYWTAEMIERRRIALQAWADYIKPIGWQLQE